MKTHISLRTGFSGLVLSLFIFSGTLAPVFAHEGHNKEKAKESSAEAKAAYPLETCVVSGDKLESGDMGEPIDYIHKEEGKPDRLVRLCCKGCVRDFKKDPAKYLKLIDEAAAKSSAEGHGGHAHR